MIPKIIHQIWIGPKKCPMHLIQTWKDKHPESEGWKHILWTNEDIEKFGIKNKKHFDEIEEWAGKADIWRYEILYRYGGFFCDADSICVNQLDEHFLVHDCFAGFENEKVRGNLIANGYIGACKENRLMKILIDKISSLDSVSQKKTGQMAWQNVGPLFFTNTVIENKYQISVYPSHLFIPEHYSGVRYEGTDKVYARQLWGSTRELSNSEFYNELSEEKDPKISIVIPIYKIDNIVWFRQCIETIDSQTFREYEVIIVNDGSPQEEVINFLNELKVRKNYQIINLEKNSGVGPALNAGIKAAKCNLIARMDADDVMIPNRLEKQYKYMMDNPDVDLLSGGIVYVQEGPNNQLQISNQGAIHPEVITKEIAKNSFWFINHPTVIFKKSSIESIGGYHDLRGLPEDYDLWIRMINADMKLRNLQEVIVGYRISANQASKGSPKKEDFLRKTQASIK